MYKLNRKYCYHYADVNSYLALITSNLLVSAVQTNTMQLKRA